AVRRSRRRRTGRGPRRPTAPPPGRAPSRGPGSWRHLPPRSVPLNHVTGLERDGPPGRRRRRSPTRSGFGRATGREGVAVPAVPHPGRTRGTRRVAPSAGRERSPVVGWPCRVRTRRCRRRPDARERRGPAGPRRVTCGTCGRVRRSAQAELPRAGRPGTPALPGQDPLGDPDLLLARGVGRVAGAAVRLPGALGELQTAPVAVAGVDRPVAAGLALGEAVPDGAAARARLGHGRGLGRPAAARGRAALAAVVVALARRG